MITRPGLIEIIKHILVGLCLEAFYLEGLICGRIFGLTGDCQKIKHLVFIFRGNSNRFCVELQKRTKVTTEGGG